MKMYIKKRMQILWTENLMNRGAQWVAKSQTRLKRLSKHTRLSWYDGF